MVQRIKEIWRCWCDDGFKLPYAYDPVSKKPSVTLLMVYLTFVLAFFSNVALHFYTSMAIATWTSMGFWALAYIFYRMRKLDKATVDFKSGSISLDGEDRQKDED